MNRRELLDLLTIDETPKTYYAHHAEAVKAKMIEHGIKNFTENELDRVFADVCAPNFCIDVAKHLISKGLTIEKLYGSR